MRRVHAALAAMAMPIMGGCVLTPEGAKSERDRAARDGASYEKKYEERVLPDIPDEPSWKDVLSRGLQASGDLEAAYFAWRAALEGIDIAGTWPNSDVNVGFSYMFSRESMKSWDRTTLTAGFDAMENLSFPTKTAQAAKVALANARAAGERFRAVKFEVQQKVLFAWADYQQQAREIEVRIEDLALRRMLADIGSISAATGGGQQSAVQADVALRMAESELADMAAEHAGTRAMLNALLGRDPTAPLGVPREPEEHRVVAATDVELIAIAAETFPEVSVFAQEVQGRRDALELARMRWIPDINPTLMFTGSIAQAIGAMVVLPTTVPEIRAGIRAADAELRAAEAMLRQSRTERIGEYVALVVSLRRAQEKAATFRTLIEPAARTLADARTRSYEAGGGELKDVIEARQMWLETRVIIARADAAAEKAVVDIECCLGVDIETVGKKEPGHE
jgi:cobalt-zinc-cadmium efflux system outer membrane protein